MRERRNLWTRSVSVVVALLGCGSSGCSSSPRPPALHEATNRLDGSAASLNGSSADACAAHNPGCPCTTDAKTNCGEVTRRSGTYTTCSMGTQTCEDGRWGACVGEYVTTTATSAIGTIRTLLLNPAAVCTNNPCDPSCNTFVNDPSGLDAGADSGITINDSGVLLTGVPVTQAACTALQVSPNTAPTKDLTLTSMAPSPNTVQFTPSLFPAACYQGTPPALWSIDQFDVAQISSSGLLTLAVPIGGPITVSAYAGTLSASVVCNVTINVVDTSAAPTGYSNSQFPLTTGSSDNISILYPYTATVFPLGLPSPLIQWSNGGTAASAVKVTLRFPTAGTPMFSWSEIVPESQTAPTPALPGQPRATIPQSVWSAFEQTVVRNSGTQGGDAVFAIQRYVSGVRRAEVPTTIHFANGQLKGNLFYQSYGTNLVHNSGWTKLGASFGAATLEVPLNGTTPRGVVGYDDPTLSGAGCRVCHTVSSDGTQLVTNSALSNGTSGGGTDTTTWTYDATQPTPALVQASEARVGASKFTFAALAPNGDYLLTNTGKPNSSTATNQLFKLDGTLIASNIPAGLKAQMASFSHDALHVALLYQGGTATPLSSLTADGKTLVMTDFSAPGTFSNFRKLVTPSNGYAAWLSFLPPSENGVVYSDQVRDNGRNVNTAETRASCDGCSYGATSELWWVSTGASPQAARLTNLNGGSYLPRNAATRHGTSSDDSTYYEEVYNYEPSSLPITIGGYSWVAFTSRRLYGNVATINPYYSDPRYQDISVQPTTKKIWMSALSTSPTPGTDPSFPAFYLPGQELLAGNSRAFLALATCEAAGPPTPSNLCTSDLDCCGSSANPQTAQCQLDPPPLANPPTSHCTALSTASCVADGSVCTSAGQCCNFATGSRCASGTCQPTPTPVLYYTAPFTTKYTAVCAAGTAPVWRFFYWQASTPTGTSIAFTAQTSPDGVTWGSAVAIGTAAPPPTVTSTWTSGPQTVDQALQAAGQVSRPQLMVTATLNPTSNHQSTSVLTNWQLQYDCPPSE